MFAFYIISVYLDMMARGRTSKILVGFALVSSFTFMMIMVKPLNYLTLSLEWAVVTIAFLACLLFGVYRGLLLIYKGLKIKELRYLIQTFNNEVEVTLDNLNSKDILGVDEGTVYLLGRSHMGYHGKIIPLLNVSYNPIGKVSYNIYEKAGGVSVRARAPRHFISGFYIGLEGTIYARCLRIRVKGNNIYISPPLTPRSYAITVGNEVFSIRSPDGKDEATVYVRIHGDALRISLRTSLTRYKAGLYIRRFNRALGLVHDEKLLEVEESGTYAVTWRPQIVDRWIIFTEDENLPFRKFITMRRRGLQVSSDLTSDVNEIYLMLVLKRGPRSLKESIPVRIEPISVSHRVRVPVE